MKNAVYPGSFDPVTLGHMDIIRRGAQICDHLTVAVLVNRSKKAVFTVEERMDFLRRSVGAAGLANVTVTSFDGLLADYTCRVGACTVLRGLRAMSDFEYEFQMALANRQLNPRLDTLFLVTNADYLYLSSSLVKEIGRYGGDIGDFVPPEIAADVAAKLLELREEAMTVPTYKEICKDRKEG